MGLFLQKTNIIRDYLEDFVDGRAFWPQEVRGVAWRRPIGSHDPSSMRPPPLDESQPMAC